MKVGAPRETFEAEARVAMTPDSALQLQKIGHTCFIESGAGLAAGFTDAAYQPVDLPILD
jgi:NAD(P) transhydrogenase subunit alpha